LITLNVVKLGEKAKSEITRRAALTSSQQMPYNLFPKLKYIHRDLNFAMDAMQKGAAPYYISFQIAIFGNTTEELNNLAGQFKSYFKTLTFAMEEDKYVLFPALLTMLPFGFDMEIQKFLSEKRGRVVFSENAISMMPVSAEWLGTNPQVPMISPKGQLFGIDLFANKAGGFNAFVIGMTGSGIPKFTYGITLNAEYKGFDLTVFGTGSAGNKIYNLMVSADRPLINGIDTYWKDSWRADRTNAKYTDMKKVATDWKFFSSDAAVFSGSYFKIKQIQLGYTLPKAISSVAGISNLRVYCSLDDFFTITKYPGADPETASMNSGASRGFDNGTYPTSKKVVFGINVTF
jgi:hypothetical protein